MEFSIKLANHDEIPRTSEGQKRGRQGLDLMKIGQRGYSNIEESSNQRPSF